MHFFSELAKWWACKDQHQVYLQSNKKGDYYLHMSWNREMGWKFLFAFILFFIPLQSAKNRRSQCISHFCFKGVGGTHCLMIRPRPDKDYLKWVFCLHKTISKIHHFFKNHKAYVYTKMKFSNFSRILIEG